jgi:hypothetical protein
MSRAAEAARQSALLAALLARDASPPAGLREGGARALRGLGAYRANAAAIAERALAASHPTVAAMLGAEDFAALARALWRASPPLRGDLAQWGAALPTFIEAQRDLDPWPWLADCARLDALVAACEAAADTSTERHTLVLLATETPDGLQLRLRPGVQLLASAWPLATLHAAHHHPAGDEGLAAAREALAAGRGECVVVARDGWRARVTPIDPPVFAWMEALLRGASLADALQAGGAGFVFDTWLVQALQQGWLWRAERRPVTETPS